MKYVRTKDGRVFLPNKIAHEPIGINGEWKAVACWYHGEPFDMEKEIIKTSENLEDLCDEFVCDHNNGTRVMQSKECKPQFPFSEKSIDYLKRNNHTFYGAIWTDKGLIYVAKMNDKGELKLL